MRSRLTLKNEKDEKNKKILLDLYKNKNIISNYKTLAIKIYGYL